MIYTGKEIIIENLKKIKVLIIEDSMEDYELLTLKLIKDGIEIAPQRVETPEEFTKYLHQEKWDLILSDNTLPQFNATQALKITRDIYPYLPFIIVSGTIGEENAVNALKSGANDYLLKDNLTRLTPAIHRELRESKNRISQIQTQEKLLLSQQTYQFLSENVHDLVSVIDNTGHYKWISPSSKKILGVESEELMQKEPFSQVHPDDYDRIFNTIFKNLLNGNLRGVQRFSYRSIRQDGVITYLETISEPVYKSSELDKIISTTRDITEQALATQLLEENQAQQQCVFDSLAEGIILVDQNDAILSYNQSAKRIINLTYAINKSLSKCIIENFELLDKSYNILEIDKLPHLKTLNSGKNIYSDIIGLKSDNGNKWLSVNCVNYSLNGLKLGVVVSFKDITELFNSKDIAYKLSVELVSLIKTANAPIFGLNLEEQITEWNDYTAKITGYSKKEALKINFFKKLITEDTYQIFLKSSKKLLDGQALTHYELPIITKEGKIVTILFNGTIRRNYDNNISGMICVGQDITELIEYREQLEHKVEERTFELKKALKNEKELVKLKSKFISTASHEFRTPLSTIQFATDFIMKYHDKAEWETLEAKLIKIQEQVVNMTSLLDEVLIMGRSQAGKIKINLSTINIKEFTAKIFEEVEYLTNYTHKIELNFDSDCEKICADEKLLRNITINLLSNAIKFSPGQPKVRFVLSCRKNLMKIIVQDWGLGIDKNDSEAIFEAFHRSDSVNDIQGTGLGLSIVKKAVELQDGEITTESELGKGSTFSVTIPITYEN